MDVENSDLPPQKGKKDANIKKDARRHERTEQENEAVQEQQRRFGSWMRDRRKGVGLSQEQAAEEAKLSANTWYRIETGQTGVRYSTIPKIAKAVRTSEAETYRAAGFIPPGETNHLSDFLNDREQGAGERNIAVPQTPEHLIAAFLEYVQTVKSVEARLERIERKLFSD